MRSKQPTAQDIGERATIVEFLARMPPQTLIGPFELSQLLDVSLSTVCNSRYRSKSLFPPPLSGVGVKLRWRIGDVLAWVDQQNTTVTKRENA